MRTLCAMLIASLVLLARCAPSDDEVRRMVRDEFRKHADRTIIAPTKAFGPYSPAVRVGNLLFVSGQVGLDQTTGMLVDSSFEAETHQALSNVMTILQAGGYDASHVVSVSVFLKNMNDFEKLNRVYAQFFPEGTFPARTTVAVSELPRNANVEIAAIAVK